MSNHQRGARASEQPLRSTQTAPCDDATTHVASSVGYTPSPQVIHMHHHHHSHHHHHGFRNHHSFRAANLCPTRFTLKQQYFSLWRSLTLTAAPPPLVVVPSSLPPATRSLCTNSPPPLRSKEASRFIGPSISFRPNASRLPRNGNPCRIRRVLSRFFGIWRSAIPFHFSSIFNPYIYSLKRQCFSLWRSTLRPSISAPPSPDFSFPTLASPSSAPTINHHDALNQFLLRIIEGFPQGSPLSSPTFILLRRCFSLWRSAHHSYSLRDSNSMFLAHAQTFIPTSDAPDLAPFINVSYIDDPTAPCEVPLESEHSRE